MQVFAALIDTCGRLRECLPLPGQFTHLMAQAFGYAPAPLPRQVNTDANAFHKTGPTCVGQKRKLCTGMVISTVLHVGLLFLVASFAHTRFVLHHAAGLELPRVEL